MVNWAAIGALGTIAGVVLALYERSQRPTCPKCGAIMVVVVMQGRQVPLCNKCNHRNYA